MLTLEDANSHTTTYTWDTNANMLSQSGQSDAGTVTTSYTYNNFGEVLTMTDPLNNVTTILARTCWQDTVNSWHKVELTAQRSP